MAKGGRKEGIKGKKKEKGGGTFGRETPEREETSTNGDSLQTISINNIIKL